MEVAVKEYEQASIEALTPLQITDAYKTAMSKQPHPTWTADQLRKIIIGVFGTNSVEYAAMGKACR